MKKCKTEAIHVDLGIFTYIHPYSHLFSCNNTYQELSKHIQTYSEPSVSSSDILRTRNIFRAVVYAELRHIQNAGVFRILNYSEFCQKSTMERFTKIVNDYNYFHNISFSRSLLCEKHVFFNTRLYVFNSFS